MAESKRYYWIKLKTEFFDLPTIDWLLSQKNGCEYIVLYQMLCLKTANNNGAMANSIGEMLIPYDIEKIVRDTKYFDFDTVTVALELFKKLGLIYQADNNVLHISGIDEMVGSETSSAKRVREHRKNKALQCNTNVTPNNALCNTEIEKDKEIDKELEIEQEKDKKETYVSIIADYSSNEDLKKALLDFVEMRQKMKGFTTRGLKLALNKLDELALDDLTKIDIVNQSVMNSWKSFYPIHSNKQQKEEMPF